MEITQAMVRQMRSDLDSGKCVRLAGRRARNHAQLDEIFSILGVDDAGNTGAIALLPALTVDDNESPVEVTPDAPTVSAFDKHGDMESLKAYAKSKGLEFKGNISRKDLLALIGE